MSRWFIWHRHPWNRKRFQDNHAQRPSQTYVVVWSIDLVIWHLSTVVPKENSIFAFAVPLYSTLPASYRPTEPLPIPDLDNTKATVLQVPHMEFELYGNQFRFRAADRAGRKFKHKETAELWIRQDCFKLGWCLWRQCGMWYFWNLFRFSPFL